MSISTKSKLCIVDELHAIIDCKINDLQLRRNCVMYTAMLNRNTWSVKNVRLRGTYQLD